VHSGLNALGDGVEAAAFRGGGERAGRGADDGVARVGDGVDGMAKADDDFAMGDAEEDVGLGVL